MDQDQADEAPTAASQTAGAAPMPATRGPVRARRVELRRTNSQYEIWMGDRCIQSFCGEFENVVRYALPEGSSQQVRIHIEPLGEIREMVTEEGRERMRRFAQQSQDRVEGLLRESAAPPLSPPDLSPASLEDLLVETERGPQLRVQEHPHRLSDSIQDDAEGNIGWRATALYHLEQEMITLRRMTEMLQRI